MQYSDSKSQQNPRNMCFWRDSQHSMLRREQSSFCYNPLTIAQKQEKAEGSAQTNAKSDIEQFFDLGFAATIKTYNFHGLYIFPIASTAKQDIVKADKTKMIEISWVPSEYSIQTSPKCPRSK